MYTNLAAYKFAPLRHSAAIDLKSLRTQLRALCDQEQLKGTILLSPEGINLCVAGQPLAVERLLDSLRAVPGLKDLQPKFSESADQPFTRMLVKIKKEIIAFGVEGIDPALRTSPKLTPLELKQWLDERRPITLLDTRNDYEVKFGTFCNAVPIGIRHFRDFPAAVRGLPAAWKQQPIVMFCTGGIRCEKAGPYLEREGFQQVYQLEGGILRYFEECGGEHFDGKCFVFDQRVGVDPNLHETADDQCFACLSPLTPDEQADGRYVPGESCSYCYRSPGERMAQVINERETAIRAATSPLPGSHPYDNFRPISVPARHDGQTLLDLLCGVFAHIASDEWSDIVGRGEILDAQHQVVSATQPVRAGERYLRVQRACREPDVCVDIRVLYEDEAILVLHKPAPLPMHPSGRFNRNTLQSVLSRAYHPQCPRPVHRLDANTTGVVLFARTRHFAKLLQPQFAQGTVDKVYLARVHGQPTNDNFSCHDPISASARETGAREIDEEAGLPSQTDFRVLRRFTDGSALLEVRPRTGRTNQIRVHLWQLGWSIRGDSTYLPGRQTGGVQTLHVGSPPLCLTAARLTFNHPVSGERLTFQTAWPAWCDE